MFDLEDRYDLRLPAWGPYTKQYMGISHIAEESLGLRFDLSVMPGFYRRRVDVPAVMWESGYHPWEAAPDLSFYSHRHQLEWRDRVYVDIAFVALDGDARLVRCRCVNATDDPQSLVLHYMASVHYPGVRPHATAPLRPVRVSLPPGGVWIDALDYARLDLMAGHPTDTLTPDGRYRGEVRGHGFVGGSALGDRFSEHPGDTVSYDVRIERALRGAALLVRFRVRDGGSASLRLTGMVDAPLVLAGDDAPGITALDVGDLPSGEHRITLTFLEGAPLELDGLALVETDSAGQVRFEYIDPAPRPVVEVGPRERSLILEYRHAPCLYGLAWDYERFQVREFWCGELDRTLRHTVHHHTRDVLGEDPDGHYTNVFLRPIPVAPRSERVLYGLVCCGERDAVSERLATVDLSPAACEPLYERARAGRAVPAGGRAGRDYSFSQERMAATLLTNVVYPVYCRRGYIRHNTPGRWWDSLYTWDSGFIGLGLAELDLQRAVDCLNAYLTPPGDPHSAFIHHGSPVPVQFYLFQELWNRTQSQELLEFCYPRLRQYHRFLAGRLGSSTTRTLRSNLLKTWDYFYNSGGWDDYPPQVYVHANHLENRVAPVINTAQAVRTAKVLYQAATALGMEDHLDEYRRDVDAMGTALLRHAWDEETGYFGYVVHDEDGEPKGILRSEDGSNYNMGLDGLYGLVAGIGDGTQRGRMLDHLRARDEVFTEYGLSAVSRAAPYYRVDGYWNGTVWMPHQWLFWKALLDHGEDELAWAVARTALDLWEREVGRTYNCFEHFVIETGRGAGWHHFGGLSAPVLCWYGTYYRPGRLTVGLDVWVRAVRWEKDHTSVAAELSRFPDAAGKAASVLVTLRGGPPYRATWQGEEVPYREIVPGCVSVGLPAAAVEGTLGVETGT